MEPCLLFDVGIEWVFDGDSPRAKFDEFSCRREQDEEFATKGTEDEVVLRVDMHPSR